MNSRFALLIALPLAVFLAGCNLVITPPAGDPPTAPSTPPVAGMGDLELTQTLVLNTFGYSIDYPDKWWGNTDSPATFIAPSETACDEDSGYCVSHDYRDANFMQSIGLPENPTAQDLLELNRGFFEWEELVEPVEREVFGVPALAVRVQAGDRVGYWLMGFVDEISFLLEVSASSEEELDAIMPTSEKMLASIKPVEQ